jgi:Na+-translocating ferredoxin:NAD+ oxidoreductase RnfE subunit
VPTMTPELQFFYASMLISCLVTFVGGIVMRTYNPDLYETLSIQIKRFINWLGR